MDKDDLYISAYFSILLAFAAGALFQSILTLGDVSAISVMILSLFMVGFLILSVLCLYLIIKTAKKAI